MARGLGKVTANKTTVAAAVAPALKFVYGAQFTAGASTVQMPADTFTTTYSNYLVILNLVDGSNCNLSVRLNVGGTPGTSGYYGGSASYTTGGAVNGAGSAGTSSFPIAVGSNAGGHVVMWCSGFRQSPIPYFYFHPSVYGNSSGVAGGTFWGRYYGDGINHDGLTFISSGELYGQYKVYGVVNS